MKGNKNMKIKVDLIQFDTTPKGAENIAQWNYKDFNEITPAEALTRDTIAPLVVAELLKKEGAPIQKKLAKARGQLFAECSAVCGSALWFCGGSDEAEALTLPDGFRPRSFGFPRGSLLPFLFVENSEEQERAYLVRFEW